MLSAGQRQNYPFFGIQASQAQNSGFSAPQSDYYRTRLTHTLEVAQIARTIARALRLNEDLTEAASLGHDLGHTPFGHAGEKALNDLTDAGFRHNEQSVRVVEKLEKHRPPTLYNASLISGITPAALDIVHLNLNMFCQKQ